MSNKFYYKLEGGVPPKLAHDTDTGYDVTLIKKIKTIKKTSCGILSLYDSGIIVIPPDGYYFDMVPRSSFSKTGYILANSFGVIDSSYRGHLMAVLLKYDLNAEDLKLPCRCMQLILRPLIHFKPVEIFDIDETDRNSNGFGSTGR